MSSSSRKNKYSPSTPALLLLCTKSTHYYEYILGELWTTTVARQRWSPIPPQAHIYTSLQVLHAVGISAVAVLTSTTHTETHLQVHTWVGTTDEEYYISSALAHTRAHIATIILTINTVVRVLLT